MKLGELLGLAAVALVGYYFYEHYYGSTTGVTVNTATSPQSTNTTPASVTGEGTTVNNTPSETSLSPSRSRYTGNSVAIQATQVPGFLTGGRVTTSPNAVGTGTRRR